VIVAPGPEEVAALVAAVLGVPVGSAHRFPTGLQHFVYDVTLADGDRAVARIAGPGRRAENAIGSGLSWTRTLREIGVPVARVLHGSPRPDPPLRPFALLERLPGSDLGLVHASLGELERRAVGEAVCDVQQRIGRLPAPGGFGYLAATQARARHDSWPAFVRDLLEGGRVGVERAGVVRSTGLPRVGTQLRALDGYLAAVPPTLFFDDATTKNVIVHEGRFCGIVDVDSLCVGDPLLALGLTKTALLSAGEPVGYVDHQAAVLGATEEQLAAVDLYAAIFCVVFLAEHGQSFNRGGAEPLDRAAIDRQRAALELLTR
jgi:aminoglycoside phosphotransferase (APT) family kinase protein